MQIPIVIDERTGVDRPGELILGGVPVPRGELREGGWFVLRGEDGAEFVVEGAPAAFWPDRSIKWLHLSGTVRLAGGRRNRFTLLPASLAPEGALRVETQGEVVRIRGGVLDADVSANADNLLSVARGGEPLLRPPGLSGSLTFVGPSGEGRRTCALSVEGAPQVIVKTASRVVVRLAGRFAAEKGEPAAELILFVELCREAPEVRLEPVFIYLGKPDEDLVASLTLTVHTSISGDGCRYGFSGERGRGWWDVIQRIEGGPRWPCARQVQLGSSFWRTEKRTFPQSSWVKAVEGRRSQGWCHLGDERGGVTASMRYFWQEYPRSMAIDADAGTITFGLVPPEAAPLDLRRYSPVIYGPPVYEASQGPFPSETHGAYGTAKAHELMLRFHAQGEDDAPERGLFFTHPCRVLTEPRHFAGANVVGQVAPADPPRDRRIEDELANIADFIVRERDYRGWYGLMDFGDIMCAFYSDRDTWAFDDGGYAWINTEHLPDLGLWLSALRAARVDWLEAAIEMSRHNRDVDTYHRGMLKGGGTRHNVNHWGCQDKEWRVSMPLVRRLHYYLTADPWTREAILETVAVYQSYDRTARTAPSMTSALAGVMTKWEMMCDPADEQVVRNMADVFARALRPDGQFFDTLHMDIGTGVGEPATAEPHTAYFFMDGFGGQHALVELAELIGHQGLSDALMAHLRFRMAQASGRALFCLLPTLAHAFRRTADESLRAAVQEVLELRGLNFVERGGDGALEAMKREGFNLAESGGDGALDSPRHLMLAGAQRKNKIACQLGEFLNMAPYGLTVLPEQR